MENKGRELMSLPGVVHFKQKKFHGFTLLEISVVVAVIGIIVAGIVVGTQIVHNARLTRMMTDIKKFTAAVYEFESIYGSLPGDIANIDNYFQSEASGGNCQTCGDGDGEIDENDEQFYFWRHMAVAELIPGDFPVGENAIPNGPFKNTFYRVRFIDN